MKIIEELDKCNRIQEINLYLNNKDLLMPIVFPVNELKAKIAWPDKFIK